MAQGYNELVNQLYNCCYFPLADDKEQTGWNTYRIKFR